MVEIKYCKRNKKKRRNETKKHIYKIGAYTNTGVHDGIFRFFYTCSHFNFVYVFALFSMRTSQTRALFSVPDLKLSWIDLGFFHYFNPFLLMKMMFTATFFFLFSKVFSFCFVLIKRFQSQTAFTLKYVHRQKIASKTYLQFIYALNFFMCTEGLWQLYLKTLILLFSKWIFVWSKAKPPVHEN